MAFDVSTKTWSDKITNYCVAHGISYKAFANVCGLHNNTVLCIVREESKKITPPTLAKLVKVIDNAT